MRCKRCFVFAVSVCVTASASDNSPIDNWNAARSREFAASVGVPSIEADPADPQVRVRESNFLWDTLYVLDRKQVRTYTDHVVENGVHKRGERAALVSRRQSNAATTLLRKFRGLAQQDIAAMSCKGWHDGVSYLIEVKANGRVLRSWVSNPRMCDEGKPIADAIESVSILAGTRR